MKPPVSKGKPNPYRGVPKSNGKHPGGRPPLVIDWDEFDKLCALQCTLQEIALWFRCEEETIERRVKHDKGVEFSRYFEQKKGTGRISLRRTLFQQAQTNPACAIFLAKNHLGMTDRQELTGKDGSALFPAAQVNIFLQESVNIFQQVNLIEDPVERERQYALRMDKLQQTRLIEGGKK